MAGLVFILHWISKLPPPQRPRIGVLAPLVIEGWVALLMCRAVLCRPCRVTSIRKMGGPSESLLGVFSLPQTAYHASGGAPAVARALFHGASCRGQRETT